MDGIAMRRIRGWCASSLRWNGMGRDMIERVKITFTGTAEGFSTRIRDIDLRGHLGEQFARVYSPWLC
jgi:hypothetical protein